jgi:hypothetical protein
MIFFARFASKKRGEVGSFFVFCPHNGKLSFFFSHERSECERHLPFLSCTYDNFFRQIFNDK